MIVDRGSLTQNRASDIASATDLVYSNLKSGGKYIALDWSGRGHHAFKFDLDREALDDFTFVFREGYFKGLGETHFTDEDEIRAIFSKFEIKYLREKKYREIEPRETTLCAWDFVALKK